MPWITLEDGTPVHVTMAKRGMQPTEEDVKAMREIAELLRRKHAEKEPQADTEGKS